MNPVLIILLYTVHLSHRFLQDLTIFLSTVIVLLTILLFVDYFTNSQIVNNIMTVLRKIVKSYKNLWEMCIDSTQIISMVGGKQKIKMQKSHVKM